MRNRKGRTREKMNITRKITFKRASKQRIDLQKLSQNMSFKIIFAIIKSKNVITISKRGAKNKNNSIRIYEFGILNIQDIDIKNDEAINKCCNPIFHVTYKCLQIQHCV
jgi:Gpi18-like mannosyltransferase